MIASLYQVGSSSRVKMSLFARMGTRDLLGRRPSPLLPKEGWLRHQEKDPFRNGADGWLCRNSKWGTITPSAPLRMLRVIFFRSRPPLLGKEGRTPCSVTSPTLPI